MILRQQKHGGCIGFALNRDADNAALQQGSFCYQRYNRGFSKRATPKALP
jgi:hypothetical protein